MIENRNNRTLICSVVFLDIVEYSRHPVAQQIRLKDRFNAVLSMALRDIAVTDRIILDTGDGAAISLIGDPQDALFVATAFRDGIAAQPPADAFQLRTRIGINLGPVRLVRDINGQPNIIGDGINVAQRVMTFAEPGQVLVSRSYHEVVSCLSDDYSKIFQYEGSRTDKHIREHEVYTVGATVPGLRHAAHARHGAAPAATGSAAQARNFAIRIATAAADAVCGKPWLATALAVIAILATAIVVRSYRDDAGAEYARAAVAGKPGVVAQRAINKPAAVAGEAVKSAPAATPPKANDREAAVVTLSITPWGEVYVDGKKQGVSPPLRDVRVAVGKHKIEVRNTSFQSHVEMVDARAGEQIRIKHKFQ
jgi:class 3 adenylate cyclase